MRRCLHKLQLLRCAKLRSEHLAMLMPLAPTLNMLSLAGCSGLTAAGAPYIASLTGLQQLDLTGRSSSASAKVPPVWIWIWTSCRVL